jgi:hypothetical protein
LLADLSLLPVELLFYARDLGLYPVADYTPVGHRHTEQDPDREGQKDRDQGDQVVPEVRHFLET